MYDRFQNQAIQTRLKIPLIYAVHALHGPNIVAGARISETELRAIHLPPYQAAVNNGVGSVMASFSSWNGVKMHGNAYLLTTVLKGELGFKGFIVSDWQAINQLGTDYASDVRTSIN